jgi:AcrR family transcriptional regulator
MNSKTSPRPGGRSARVQAAVHLAVQQLAAEIDRADLTVPMIAERAGVTPSTIYRRWGTLADLLSDVAVGSLRAESAPIDTGTVLGDLQAWAELYLDEMTSAVGLTMMHDVLASNRADASCQCAVHVAGQIQQILDRGIVRREAVPQVEAVMDAVVAPIIYRALFGPTPPTASHVRGLVERCVANAAPAQESLP